MLDAFEIRSANGADRDDIIRLVGNMVPDTAARYDWIYLSNPHGRALTWLAIERASGQTVGCTSLFPRRVLVAGTERMGSIGGDCYIEPRVRRRGLATGLHRASFEGMRQGGVDFMYGPPAIHNLHALLKAGSHLVTEFEQWVFPLSLRAMYASPWTLRKLKAVSRVIADLPRALARRLASVDLRGVNMEQAEAFGSEFDRLFGRVAGASTIFCVRDREYLAWRYLEAPGRRQIPFAVRRKGELVGFVALEVARERASVIDFFTAPEPELIDATLEAVLDHSAAVGCSILDIACASESVLLPRVRSRGFFKGSGGGFQVAVSAGDPQLETLLSLPAWHFMTGDTDLNIAIPAPVTRRRGGTT